MKRAILLISPDLLVDLFRTGPTRAFDVTTFALPEDARFVDVRYINSAQHIAIEVESEQFNDVPAKGLPPVLPCPVCRVVSEDELLTRAVERVYMFGTATDDQPPKGLLSAFMPKPVAPDNK